MLRDLELPELPNGPIYRGMGTMEDNVCVVITLRMKNRKINWSEEGANNLARLLTARVGGSPYQQLDKIFDDTVSDDILGDITAAIQLSAVLANKKPKKSNIYPMRGVSTPYEGQPPTESGKAIRNLVDNRIASDLNFLYQCSVVSSNKEGDKNVPLVPEPGHNIGSKKK